MAASPLPRFTPRYTLTLDPDVMLMGMSHPNEQDAALRAAAAFQPLSSEELARMRERAREAIQGKGAVWGDPPAAATGAG